MEEGEEETLREDERARQGGQELEPAVNRVRAAEEEETTESDDSGPPGLMDMDGNVLSSSSEDEEEVARRREWVQDGGPNLTESSDGGEESDVSDVDDHQGVDARPRVGRLRLPALLNGMLLHGYLPYSFDYLIPVFSRKKTDLSKHGEVIVFGSNIF